MNDDVRFRSELVHDSVFLAAGVHVLGDVTIGADSSVWFNSVIRGDTAPVAIGSETNVQDLCMLHADPGFPCRLGDRVTVGHRAIIHGAEIANDVMIGMGAIVLNGAHIEEGSVIAAGAVVTEGAHIPAGSLVMGVPGKVRGELSEAQKERITHAARHYVEQARKFRDVAES